MLDDDVNAVKKLGNDILKATNNATRKERWPQEEKLLCNFQVDFINSHIKECSICEKSMESYKQNFGIPLTPPCKSFLKQMKEHIDTCKLCNTVNKKWNDDAVPITDEMRKGAEILGRLKRKVGL